MNWRGPRLGLTGCFVTAPTTLSSTDGLNWQLLETYAPQPQAVIDVDRARSLGPSSSAAFVDCQSQRELLSAAIVSKLPASNCLSGKFVGERIVFVQNCQLVSSLVEQSPTDAASR